MEATFASRKFWYLWQVFMAVCQSVLVTQICGLARLPWKELLCEETARYVAVLSATSAL